jgi:cysteine desulfurase
MLAPEVISFQGEKMNKRIYMDYAATTPVRPEVIAAMLPYYTDFWGNPSSIYACGQARRGLEEARGKIAALLGAREEEIIFTSGGTEADNTAIEGVAFANQDRGNHIITTSVEHHAVLMSCRFMEERGFTVTYLPVDQYGLVDPDAVKKAITPKTILISIMHANNEIGTLQPITEISRVAKEAGIYLHTDAVQTVGHIPARVNDLGVDLLALSAHKFYGPKGIGVLYIRKGTRLTPFVHGGEQERGRRASTENVAGAVGLGRAAELAGLELEGEMKRLTSLRDRLIKGVLNGVARSYLNGHPDLRLPNNTNFSFDYIEGEAILLNLDNEGICVATGSACTSSSAEPSHVLRACGLPPLMAHSSIRMSLGKWTEEADIDTVLKTLPPVIDKLRRLSPLTPAKK